MATVAADIMVRLVGDASGLHASVEQAVSKIQGVGKSLENVGKTWSKAITAPIVGGLAAVIKAGSDFESAFAGVRKTVDATEQEFAVLRQAIRDMAKEIPATREEIAGVMEAAGQLGIAKEHLVTFTRTMVDLGVATNMTSEEAAMALARLANITQMPQSAFDRLGATIVHLGNNLATTESEIVEMGLRIAGAGHQIGLTEHQILGFAAALSSVGINAEAGGSAISRFMIRMSAAVAEGGRDLQTFAAVAGMSAEEFARAFRETPAEAMTLFIEGLGEIGRAGGDVFAILESLGLTEIRLRDAILRLAGSHTVLRESLDLAAVGWEENAALTEEASRRYETVASKWQMLKNRATDLLVTLYDALRPTLLSVMDAGNRAIDWAERGVEWFARLDPEVQRTALALAALVAGIGPLLVVGGKVIGVLGGMVGAFAALASPIGAVIAAVAAFALAWQRNWGGIRDVTETVIRYIAGAIDLLPQVFRDRLQAVFTVVSAIVQRIVGVMRLLSPLVRHSPSLVEEVETGVERIVDAYERVTEIEQPISQASGAIERLKEAAAAGLDAVAQKEREALETTLAVMGEGVPEAYREAEAAIAALRDEMDVLAQEIADQEKVVADWESKLDDAKRTVKEKEQALRDLEDQFKAVESAIKDTESAIKGLAGVRLAEELPFDERLAELERAQLEIRRQITAAQLAGADDEAIEGLRAQLERLRKEAELVELDKKLAIDPLKQQLQELADEALGTNRALTFDEAMQAMLLHIERLGKLREEHGQLAVEVANAETALAEATAYMKEVEANHEAAVARLDELKETYDGLEAEVKEYEAALNDIERAASDLEAEMTAALEEVGGAHGKLAEDVEVALDDIRGSYSDLVDDIQAEFADFAEVSLTPSAVTPDAMIGRGADPSHLYPEPPNVLVAKFQEFADTADTLRDKLGGVKDRALEIIQPIAAVAAGVGAAVLTFQGGVSAVGAITAAWAGLTGAAGSLSASIGLIPLALAALVAAINPVTLVIGGLAAAVGLVTALFIADFPGIRDAVLGALEPLLDTFERLWNSLKSSGLFLLEQLRALWESLQPALSAGKTILAVLATVVGGVLVSAFGILLGILNGVLAGLTTLLPTIVTVIGAGIGVITGLIDFLVAYFSGMFGIIKGILTGDFAGAWEAAKQMVSRMAQALLTIIGNLAGGIGAAILGMVEAVYRTIDAFVRTVINYFSALYRGVVEDHAKRLWQGVVSFITRLRDDVGALWDAIKSAAESAWQWIRDTVTNLASALRDWVVDRIRGLQNSLAEAWENEKRRAETMWTAIRDTVVNLATTLRDWVGDRITALRDALASLWDAVKQKAEAIWTAIRDTVVNLATTVRDRVTGTITEARDTLARLWDEISRKASDTWEGIKRAIEGGKGAIASALKWPFEQLRDAVGGIMGEAYRRVAGPINRVIGGLETMAGAVAGALRWVGEKLGIGALSGLWAPSFGRIPEYAKGVTNAPGGLALVGEEGPELMYVPKGATIFPADKTRRILEGIAGTDVQPAGTPLHGVGGLLDDAKNAVKSVVGSVANTVMDWAAKGAAWVVDQALSAVGGLRLDLPGVLSQATQTILRMVREGLTAFIRELIEDLKNKADQWVLPLPRGSYVVTQEFGPPLPGLGYNFHTGIDLAAPRGTSVYAARAGRVYAAGWDYNDFSLGYYVGITHADGYQTLYGHLLRQPLVRVGQEVAAGQMIGQVDNTGYSFGDHLHFMVRRNGQLINPRQVLAFAGGGWITEPVFGTGMRTGRGYLFGEAGWEKVTPIGAEGARSSDRESEAVAVHFHGPVEIIATDRREAERAAGDIAWGVRTRLRRKGVTLP